MSLPIGLILWAGNDADHDDHLHVEGTPKLSGVPPWSNPGRTAAVNVVYEAMNERYGTPYYFLDDAPPEPNWSHMGWYNRRPIAGTNIWSQHAYANALDIGPLYGTAEQREIYEFLVTGGNMAWQKPGDLVVTKQDVKEVHLWQGQRVLRPADVDKLWADNSLQLVHDARLLSELMAMDLRKADR